MNRTRRSEGTRNASVGLIEIDTYATNAKHWNEVTDETEKMVLKTMQTGSKWSNSVTFRTGQCDDDTCDLCKEAKETTDHIWYCKRLKETRQELDAELAEGVDCDEDVARV